MVTALRCLPGPKMAARFQDGRLSIRIAMGIGKGWLPGSKMAARASGFPWGWANSDCQALRWLPGSNMAARPSLLPQQQDQGGCQVPRWLPELHCCHSNSTKTAASFQHGRQALTVAMATAPRWLPPWGQDGRSPALTPMGRPQDGRPHWAPPSCPSSPPPPPHTDTKWRPRHCPVGAAILSPSQQANQRGLYWLRNAPNPPEMAPKPPETGPNLP